MNSVPLFKNRRTYMKVCMYLIYITFLTTPVYVDAFNAEIHLSTVVSFGEKDTKSSNDYFGYSFSFDQMSPSNPTGVKLVVGAPKKKKPNDGTIGISLSLQNGTQENSGSGDILSCAIDVSTSTYNCSPIVTPRESSAVDPNAITHRDNLGFSILSPSYSHNLAVCAPFRIKSCPTGFLSHGTCYNSVDFGQSWTSNIKGLNPECGTVALDLIFLLDGSSSVGNEDLKKVLNWVVNVSSNFEMRDFAKIGVVQFSHFFKKRTLADQPYLKTEIALGAFDNILDFKTAVENIAYQGFTTFTAHAINKTVLDFKTSPRFNDSETKKILILLTDGRSNDPQNLKISADYARSLGIIIYAVGVASFSENELKTITGTTEDIAENDLIYGLTDFSDLNKIVRKLQQAIIGILEGGFSGSKTNNLGQSQSGISGYQDAVSIGFCNKCLKISFILFCLCCLSCLSISL